MDEAEPRRDSIVAGETSKVKKKKKSSGNKLKAKEDEYR